jgi:isopropylmalate/homocitrate/citramalate synthase
MILNDVTIREGAQMPGRAYSAEQKIEAGVALDHLGVDYIQAGFAVTGDRDQSAIAALATECTAAIVSIARAIPRDVEAALDAEADVIEVFGPLSASQLEHTIGKTREEMYTAIAEAIDRVSEGGATPHLTLVDAYRTESEHIIEAFESFSEVPIITLADTIGASTPRSVRTFLRELSNADIDVSQVGVHFHDDLGVATANALAAHEAGVGRADVSVASIGERAGNTAIEELVAAGVVEYDEAFGVNSSELVPVCRDVLDALGESVDPRKAVLGSEVTQHESGIHTAAMLSEPSVMEPFDPERFGGSRTLLFGEKTGRGGARRLLELAGREPDNTHVDELLSALAEQGPIELDEATAIAERI